MKYTTKPFQVRDELNFLKSVAFVAFVARSISATKHLQTISYAKSRMRGMVSGVRHCLFPCDSTAFFDQKQGWMFATFKQCRTAKLLEFNE